jgi:hypothetical protein
MVGVIAKTRHKYNNYIPDYKGNDFKNLTFS